MLTGDNGIVKKAIEAKESTEIAEDKEQIQLLYRETQTNLLTSKEEMLNMTKNKLDEIGKYETTISEEKLIIINKKTNALYELENGMLEYQGIKQNTNSVDPVMQVRKEGEAFWIKDIREKVTEVRTKNYIAMPNNIIQEWDVSDKKDKSVLAWIVDDGNGGYKLTIASNGKTKPKSCMSMFQQFYQVEKIDLSNWDTSDVKDMSAMFYKCSMLKELNIKKLDTGNVTNMSQMFRDLHSMQNIDVSTLNTHNVTNMSYMLSDIEVTELDLSNFDTSNVVSMNNMFQYNQKLVSINMKGIDTSKVTNMSYMFYQCRNLKELDLSEFNTSNVTNMGNMFYDCRLIENIFIGGKWSVENVNISNQMFENCKKLPNWVESCIDKTNAHALTNGYMTKR